MSSTDETVSDSAIIDQLFDFLISYKQSGNYPYYDQINGLISKDEKALNVKISDLPSELHKLFFRNKEVEEHLGLLTEATRKVFKDLHPDLDYEDKDEGFDIDEVVARLTVDDPHFLIKQSNISIDLRNKLVAFDCTVTGKTEKKASFITKKFACSDCPSVYSKKLNKCPSCGERDIVFSPEHSIPVDSMYIEVRELQDEITHSKMILHSKKRVKVIGPLVNHVEAGQNVRIVGIVKMVNYQSDAILNKSAHADFSNDLMIDLIIEAHNIEHLSSTSEMIMDNPYRVLTTEDINSILKMRKDLTDDQLLNKLISQFIPAVHGYPEIKLAMMLQIVGLPKINEQRDKIHIMIVGDPGMAKSRLINGVQDYVIHSAKASGTGSSGVGLTASTKRIDGVGTMSIGAAVIADGGLLRIDEYNNISAEHKSHLHEVMEEQKYYLNKDGINAVLNTRCDCLIASNPDRGKYSPYNTFFENVTISPQIFSRLDYIFVLIDKVDRKKDDKLTDHIRKLYKKSRDKTFKENKLDNPLFKYLVYAKVNNDEIEITDNAHKMFQDFYSELRKPTRNTDITATPRQYETLIRSGMAFARLLLKNRVDESEAQRVINLMTHALKSARLIDDLNTAGMNQTAQYAKDLTKMKPEKAFFEVMERLTNNNTEEVTRETVEIALKDDVKISIFEATELFQKMYDANRLLQTRSHYFKINSDLWRRD